MRLRTGISLLVVIVLALNGLVTKADTQATVTGLITDATGGRVVGAAIQFTNLNTNAVYKTESNDVGFYSVGLPPGIYRAHVIKEGFKGIVKSDIELHVQDAVSLNFSLQVGSVTESVTVAGGAPLVNTVSAVVGTVVERQFVANMPLNGRSFQSLISLTPGVVIAATSASSQGQFSINGQRPDANYFMVDGVSANIGISPSGAQNSSGAGSGVQVAATGGYNNLVSVDAMQEFKIETSTFAPEYGRLPGGQISIVTRSGTNAFHGDLFEYLRNTVFDANNWFNNHNRIKRPAEHQNDFGGVLGGPIIKDKLFFFGSYEGLRLGVPQSVTANVPSLAARHNAVAAVLPYLSAYPMPNVAQCATGTPGCDPNVATFVGAYTNTSALDAFSVRLDWMPTDKMTIFARGNDAPSSGTLRAAMPSSFQNLSFGTKTLTLGQTYLFRPTMSNDLRFNYSYTPSFSQNFLDDFGGAVPPPASAMFVDPYTANDSTFLFSGRTIGALSVGSGAKDRSSQVNIIDNLSWIHGTHQVKFGIDYRRLHPSALRNTFGQTIAFTLTTASWVQGTPNIYQASAFPTKDFIYDNWGVYAQDTWKVTPRFTLSYGLRWDLNPAPGCGPDRSCLQSLIFDPNNLAATEVGANGTPIYETQKNAFAPRVGFAYQLSQSTNWGRVIRGGYGLFFDTAAAASGFAERPFLSVSTANPGPLPIPAALTVRPTIPTAPPWGFVATVNPKLRLPYTHHLNLALEQSLGSMQALTVTYAGAIGRNLLRRDQYLPPNKDLPQGFYAVGNESYSDYHSMQVLFQRRKSHGLQMIASYTWSHSTDTGSNQSGTDAINAYLEPVSDYHGNSDFDIRHSFQMALTYDIPGPSNNRFLHALLGNWGADTMFRARTAPPIELVESNVYLAAGQPFLPGTKITNVNGIKFPIRPNVVPGVPMEISDPTAPGGKRLNPAAFVLLPANTVVNTQGTLGRNYLRGFGWNQVDFTIRREFPLHESFRLQFRTDFFNLFNHSAFAISGSALDITSPLFATSNSTLNNGLGSGGAQGGFSSLYQVGGPRSVQFSLKLVF